MFTHLLVNLIKNCFIIVGVFVAMLCLNYLLTLMVLCFVPFIILFTVIFRKFSRKAYRRVKDATTDINTFLSENLSGMKIIQVFNREDRKAEEFEEKNQRLGSAKHKQIFVFGIFRPMVYMLYVSSVMALFYLSATGYIEDREFLGQTIGSGVLVSFYMFISRFFNPIQNLAEQFNWMQSAFASAEKIFTILDMKPEIVDEPDAIELDHIDGNIEVDFNQFAQIVDLLGGVTMELRQDEADVINRDAPGTVSAGTQLLTGQQALAYARIRSLDADGDFSRTNRQRKVISALLDSYKNASLSTVLSLLDDILPMITTDMNDVKIIAYATELFPMLSGADIVSQRIPADGSYSGKMINGMSVLVADMEASRQLLEDTLLN